MKTRLPLFLAVLVVFIPAAFAQRRGGAGGAPRLPGGAPASSPSPASTPSTPATPPPGGSTAGVQSAVNPENDNVWSVAQKLINSDSLNVDTENGVFTWNNSKFDIGNNLIVRSRFERYLSSPGYPDTGETYEQVIQKIEDLLSYDSGNTTPLTDAQKNERETQAWQELFVAAKYPQDGGASATLANQISNAWAVRAELSNNRDEYVAILKNEQEAQTKLGMDVESEKHDAKDALQYDSGPTGAPGGAASNATTRPNVAVGTGRQANSTTNNSSSGASGGFNGSSPTFSSNLSNSTGTSGSGEPSDPVTPAMQAANNLGQPIMNVAAGQIGDIATAGLKGPDMMPSAMDSENVARYFAKESLLDADATAMGLQVKLQFQTQLLAFIAQRRFQHSLMAGEFYQHIFKGSQQRFDVAKEEMSHYINTSDFVPSVTNFEFMSHEAIADVDTGMRAVNAAYDAGNRWIALQQLQQTFLLGENLPSVQQFDPAKRIVLLSIYRESIDLTHMMDDHDFAGAEATLKQLEAEAKDFEAAPVVSAIKEGEQMSTNYVRAASLASRTGDTDTMNADLQKATEMWPLNPEIGNLSKTLLDRTDLQSAGTQKFDDLLAHNDDRGIYDDRDEIGLAIYQDPVRTAKLKTILDRMGQVEMSISFADQALKQNNGYAAWEALQTAADLEPNDPVLARSMRQVAPRVPNFVAALDSADRAAKAGAYAAAINYYLEAQDIYPASHICADAIDNLSLKIMAKLNPNGASAKTLAAQQAAAQLDAKPSAPTDANSPSDGGTPDGNSAVPPTNGSNS